MTYSVWDPARKIYRYYETREASADQPSPRLPKAMAGISPEKAAWRVPSGARFVGAGALPQGMIAANKGSIGLGDTDTDIDLAVIAGFAIIGYGAYRLTRKPKRKGRR